MRIYIKYLTLFSGIQDMYKSNSKKIGCAVFAKPFSKAGNNVWQHQKRLWRFSGNSAGETQAIGALPTYRGMNKQKKKKKIPPKKPAYKS